MLLLGPLSYRKGDITLLHVPKQRNDIDTRFDEFGNLSVSELRKRLADDDLDIDGSKEMLVSRLNESESAKKRQRTE